MHNTKKIIGTNVLSNRIPKQLSLPYEILKLISYFTLGFFSSFAGVFSGMTPLGLSAITAADSMSGTASALIGASLGYLLNPNVQSPLRYLAAAIAAASIRWVLESSKYLIKHPAFLPAICFLTCFSTGITLISIDGIYVSDIFLYVSEGFIAAGASYFYSRATKYLFRKDKSSAISKADLISFSIVILVLLIALMPININSFSIGKILAATIILSAAFVGNESSGAVVGIICGGAAGLSSTFNPTIIGAFSLGGVLAGVFSNLGRLSLTVSFLITNAAVLVSGGMNESVIISLYEAGIGAVIFIALPTRLLNNIKNQLNAQIIPTNNINSLFASKLKSTSKALSELLTTSQHVYSKYNQKNPDDLDKTCSSAVECICKKCLTCFDCWDEHFTSTNETFTLLREKVKQGKSISEKDFSINLLSKCKNIRPLCDTLNQSIGIFRQKQQDTKMNSELRLVVTSQIDSTARLLDELSLELQQPTIKNAHYSAAVKDALTSFGFGVEMAEYYDNNGKVLIKAKCRPVVTLTKQSKNDIAKRISTVCHRQLDTPECEIVGDNLFFTLSQKPQYTVDFGLIQLSGGKESICGDCAQFFCDNTGCANLIISDGMGSGKNAAIDGKITSLLISRLKKAGLSFETALNYVSSAMLIKSSEETLATLDIASINLFSGETTLLKAGATTTFVRKNGKVKSIDIPSMPIGIVSEVSFGKHTLNLCPNDVVLLVSDGVTANDSDWIMDELTDYTESDPQMLAENIAKIARNRFGDEHQDDITVFVAIIRKAV